MKIAVYAICKNEIDNVEGFMKNTLDADYVYITDTGSTDGTQSLLRDWQDDRLQFFEMVMPFFRFDYARNFCLNQIPQDIDYCLFLDLDERLEDGWYEKLIRALKDSPDSVYMDLIQSVDENNEPLSSFYQLKCHKRTNFTWRYPCHEVLITDIDDSISVSTEIKVYHNPSDTERNYLPLLEVGAQERPDDQRTLYYYGRALYAEKRYIEAIEHLDKALDAPYMQWIKQKASCYKYLALSHHELSGFSSAEYYYLQYLSLSLDEAEAFYEVAMAYYDEKSFEMSKALCLRLIKLAQTNQKTDNFIYRDLECWTWKPYDLLAYLCYELGDYNGYLVNAVKAVELNPTDDRLKANALDAYNHVHPNEQENSDG